MFPAASSFRLFLFAFCLLIFDFCCAYPSPSSHTSTVFPRQETRLTSPVTVTHTERITTGVGTFLRTCNITLSPTTVDGADMVREETTCMLTPDNGNGNIPGALPPPGSSTDIPSPTVSPNPTVTNTPPVVVIGISSVPKPAATPQPGTPQPQPGGPQPGSPQPPSPDLSTTTSPPPSPPSPTPTATSENAGAAPFEPPGKKLEVLPIGLGVFAGVSVVALFVVGIVTYERTKHRRNFRKLKLEEAGNRLGYGAT